jgi:glyoxylase-like metal-dependent hydrolase (beta-lactamase superfamily II)
MPTQNYICTTCGTQFPQSDSPPPSCPICTDKRQFVNWDGQQWTNPAALAADHKTAIREEDTGLLGVGMEPAFAIGQRALLVRTDAGNVLWDCISLVDDHAIETVHKAGGLSAIAISHPHYYTAMIEWSRAFGGVPVYLHAADQEWVMRPGQEIVHWDGQTKQLPGGITLIRCGGHFEGATVLHWENGADGKGALLTGDVLQVTQDRRYVSFMYSYPNYIPLNAAKVSRIADAVAPFPFERIFGAWWNRNVTQRAKECVSQSVDRYLTAIS